MKIGPHEPKPAGPAAAQSKATPAAAPAPAQAGVEASTQVALSSTAQGLASTADGSFDAQKVHGIAQAIRDGKYQVNPEAIADKLISNASELLGRKAS